MEVMGELVVIAQSSNSLTVTWRLFLVLLDSEEKAELAGLITALALDRTG
jgi:hypothetical protein